MSCQHVLGVTQPVSLAAQDVVHHLLQSLVFGGGSSCQVHLRGQCVICKYHMHAIIQHIQA